MQEQRGGFYTIAAWQKGDDLVVEIYAVTQKFPRHELYGLTSQLRRAAVSVPANIAEGSGRRTIRDYIRFLYNAKGSLTEVEYLIHISNRLGYFTEEDFRSLRSSLRQTAGTLLGLSFTHISGSGCGVTGELERWSAGALGFCFLPHLPIAPMLQSPMTPASKKIWVKDSPIGLHPIQGTRSASPGGIKRLSCFLSKTLVSS